MKDFLRTADEVPVTMVVGLAYATLALLTDPFDPSAEQLDAFGWLTPLQTVDQPWRLLAHAFLHGGFVHLAFNTWLLVAIGPPLERAIGSLRMALLYVLSALGGGLAVCLLYDFEQPIVGGSGALFGMLGALVAINMHSGRHLLAFLDFEGPRRLLALIGVNLALGFLIPFISNTAHVGGLVAGFAVTFLWLARPRTPLPHTGRWRLAVVAVYAALVFHALVPCTRHDWLWNRSVTATGAERRALQRAAAMAFYGLDRAGEADVDRFVRDVLEGR
jgi:membrane associated rhomboid family serine protease